MREDKKEYACELQDVSVGGAGIAASVPVALNERLILQFEQLGSLEATVTRTYRDGFGVQFKTSPHKREKLAAQIMWLLNRDAYPETEGRQHERVGISGRKARLTTPDNIIIDVDVIDISASGASVATAARPIIGTEVVLGQFKAIVRRHHDQGLGLQFTEMQDLNVLRQSLL